MSNHSDESTTGPIASTDDPLLSDPAAPASNPDADLLAPSSPRVGCYVALYDTYEDEPYAALNHSPLSEAVADALGVAPGYKVGQFEAEHPIYLWATTLARACYQRLAEDEEEEEPAVIMARRARVWFDEIDKTFVLIADREILEDAALLSRVITCFGLSHTPYRICVEPQQIPDILASEELTEAEAQNEPEADSEPDAEVLFDAASGRVIIQRHEAGFTPSRDHRPRPGDLHELDYTKPPPDWYVEKAQQIPMWLDELFN